MTTRYRLPVYAQSIGLPTGQKSASSDGWFYPANVGEENALLAMGAVADDLNDPNLPAAVMVSGAGNGVNELSSATFAAVKVGSGGGSGGAGQVVSYVGQVVTRCRFPNTFNSTQKQMNAESVHIYRGDPTDTLAWKLVNSYVPATGVFVETGTGAPATFTTAVVLPDGTKVQGLFGGATSGVAADNGVLWTDAIPLGRTVRDGDVLRFRQFMQSTGGVVYFTDSATGISGMPGPLDERVGVAVSGMADQTMAASVTNTVSTTGVLIATPAAVVATKGTTKRSFIAFSNSRCAGSYDSQGKDGNLGELFRSIGTRHPYMNYGIPSDHLQYIATLSSSTNRFSSALYASDAIIGDCINDTRTGAQNLAQLQAIVVALVAALLAVNPLLKIWTQTSQPNPTTSDGFITSANQTVATTGESTRVSFNNWLRTAIIPGVSGCIDIADVMETGRNSGKLVYNPDTALFYAETNGLHCVLAGYQRIASSGIVQRTLGI